MNRLRQHEATEQCLGGGHCPFVSPMTYSMNIMDNSIGMVCII